MSDSVDRQQAIDALDGEITITGQANVIAVKGYINLVKDRLERLPPAQPKRIRGKWAFKNDLVAIPTGYYECSECKIGRLMYKENFCPNCGADMREDTE